jgi:hypothetical protein
MSESLKYVVDLLRRSGLPDVAEEASKTLPDPVGRSELERFAVAHGLSPESLAERMGGSP